MGHTPVVAAVVRDDSNCSLSACGVVRGGEREARGKKINNKREEEEKRGRRYFLSAGSFSGWFPGGHTAGSSGCCRAVQMEVIFEDT